MKELKICLKKASKVQIIVDTKCLAEEPRQLERWERVYPI